MKKDPLSDAERQRKRRQKLREEMERAKYAPEQFIAKAVKNMLASNSISPEQRDEIIKNSVRSAKAVVGSKNILLQRFIEKLVIDFLKSEEL